MRDDDLPLISVVTPSYNQGEFIEENLRSVMNQDYPNVEHIVVDGGSTDETLDILKEYENKYNLRWVSEEDRGQSHAINKGIEMAEGEWIGWQNSDDYYLPNAFKIFRNTLRENPNADVIYGNVRIINECGEEINRLYKTIPSKFIQRHWSLFASNQSTFIRKYIFNDVGMIDEDLKYSMDADLFWRILNADYDLVNTHDFLGVIRRHKEAKTVGRGFKTKQQQEVRESYDYPTYEKILPNFCLEVFAQVLKAIYLVREREWDAIKYKFRDRLKVV